MVSGININLTDHVTIISIKNKEQHDREHELDLVLSWELWAMVFGNEEDSRRRLARVYKFV